MSIRIGNVKSIGKSENFEKTPDDRQELVQLVGGATVIDGWNGVRQTVGDTTGLTATFSRADAETVIGWWNNRTLQNVVMEDGTTLANARIVVKRISYPEALLFRSRFVILDLEFWKV